MKPLKAIATLAIILSAFSSIPAYATGGTINFTFAGAATSIPTLSTTMLIVLSLLLFVVALRMTKQKKIKGGNYFVLLIGVSIFATTATGIKFISEASASSSSISHSVSCASQPLVLSSGAYDITNDCNSDYTMEITAGEGSSCDAVSDSEVALIVGQYCVNGATLSAGATCSITCGPTTTMMGY